MASHPQQSLTKINVVTRKMVGDAAHPKMATKGAETWGLLIFLAEELKHHHGRLSDGVFLSEAADCIVRAAP